MYGEGGEYGDDGDGGDGDDGDGGDGDGGDGEGGVVVMVEMMGNSPHFGVNCVDFNLTHFGVSPDPNSTIAANEMVLVPVFLPRLQWQCQGIIRQLGFIWNI